MIGTRKSKQFSFSPAKFVQDDVLLNLLGFSQK